MRNLGPVIFEYQRDIIEHAHYYQTMLKLITPNPFFKYLKYGVNSNYCNKFIVLTILTGKQTFTGFEQFILKKNNM